MSSRTGPGGSVPPAVRTPRNVLASDFDVERLENMDCVVDGSIRADPTVSARIISVCQRGTDPCKIEIDYELEGEGVYDIEPLLTGFSLDSTNGIDGSWYAMTALETDSRHTGNRVTLAGKFQGRFVADMCDHISTWMSEGDIDFRITFKLVSGFTPGGALPPGVRSIS